MSDDVLLTIQERVAQDSVLSATIEQRPTETIQPAHTPTAAHDALAQLEELSKKPADERLVLRTTLGEGGMGVVRLAEQVSMGREVAVKTVREQALGTDAAVRVLREAWVTGSLEHPNIVPVYDVGVSAASGAPLIVMKRIEGSAWRELLADHDAVRARFETTDPIEWHLRVLESVCNAVQFAHSRGILHRDLKPDNVMVGAFGEVYVLDWGIAVSLEPDPTGRLPDRASATEIAGTPAYMAPEMLSQDPEQLSPRTDVYLLGAMLYELFAGRAPHEGDSLQEMLSKIVQSAPEFPLGFPAEARAIAERAMARAPEDRFESAAAFRGAIQGYLRHRGSRRLAFEAKQSLERLLEVLSTEPAGPDRSAAVFNLLGECRFGYRAALEAWPENQSARQGLDRALIAVIHAEVSEGDPLAAQALAREASALPEGLLDRVERAAQTRSAEDDRLRRLAEDHDRHAGTRTRTVLGALLGISWTLVPLVGAIAQLRGHAVTHRTSLAFTLLFLLLSVLFRVWARDSLGKTQVNRGLSATLIAQLVAQLVLGVGAWAMGLSAEQALTLHLFAWCLTKLLVTVWGERWFALLALTDAVCFVFAARHPGALLWLMSATNLVFTVMVVRLWLPAQDVARIQAGRAEFRRRTRSLLQGERPARSAPREE
jgi:hypothetical protein